MGQKPAPRYRRGSNYLDIGHYGQSEYYIWMFKDGRFHKSPSSKSLPYELSHRDYFIEELGIIYDDHTFGGRFEVETGMLSLSKAHSNRFSDVPEVLIDKLFRAFGEEITEIVEFN
jgi:hypothetical protein